MGSKYFVGLIGLTLTLLFSSACVPEDVRLPQSPLLALLERKSGRIAYVGVDGNIYTIDQGGANQVAITEDADLNREDGIVRYYDFPTWEQHGDRLAYQGVTLTDSGRQTVELFTNTSLGGNSTEIYSSDEMVPIYLYWSPDGKLVSFLSASIGGGPLALQVASSVGGEVEIIDTGQPYYWAWSPNEQQLLAHVGGAFRANPGGARLSFLTMGSPVREMGLSLEPSFFQAPDFSPDGNHIVFAVDSGVGEQELVLASSDGDVQTLITDLEGPVAFDWAPNGKHIAYISGGDPTQGILGKLNLVNVENRSSPFFIETDADTVAAFFWSPDGSQVAYFVPTIFQNPDEESENVENRDGEPAAQEAQPELFLTTHIVDAATGETRQLISFRPTPQFLNILPFFDQYQRSTTLWSPDGQNLVLSALRADGSPGIFVVPSSGQLGERFLVDGSLAFWSWE